MTMPELLPGTPCKCACQLVHRDRLEICETENAVTVRVYGPELTGMGRAVDVPLCRPCANVQGTP